MLKQVSFNRIFLIFYKIILIIMEKYSSSLNLHKRPFTFRDIKSIIQIIQIIQAFMIILLQMEQQMT